MKNEELRFALGVGVGFGLSELLHNGGAVVAV